MSILPLLQKQLLRWLRIREINPKKPPLISQQPPGLRRVLTLLDATMINVGSILASGIFLVPAIVAMYLGASSLIIAVWIIGGIISLFGALSVAELGAAMPRSGGQFVYLQEAYGPVWGFLYGWAAFAVINTGAIAAVAVAFAEYLGFFIPFTSVEIKIVAITSIVLLTALNTIGVKSGIWAQNIFTFLKVAALLSIVLLAFVLPGGKMSNFNPVLPVGSLLSLSGPLGLAMVAILWTYDAWIEITYVASEVKNPGKNIPLSLLFSMLIIITIYILTTIAFMYTLGITQMSQSELVASDSAIIFLGTFGASFVALSILISTLGANNGFILTSARISYAMSRAKVFFAFAGKVHPKFRTPAYALIIQGIWASLLTLTGSYEQLFTYVIFASWIFYGMSCGAVIILRIKRPELPRPYKTWGYPWVPVIFIVFAIWLTLNIILTAPRDSAIGIIIILSGLPAYFYWKRTS